MSQELISIKGLDFYYGNKLALQDLNLLVQKSNIFGFLGPNGAGKTTVIKILLGLLQVPDNKVFLFDKDINRHRIEILKRTGSLIESPSLYPHLSGFENLKLTATLFSIPESKIRDVLEIVEMEKDAHRPTKQYSTGMKQRLSIALSLIRDPELLILDEPVNGLDPTGIMKVRTLLLNIQKELKTTVFISSHQLSEIEKLAGEVAIIDQGKLLFQGNMIQLEQKLHKRHRVSFKVSDLNKAQQVLSMHSDHNIEDNTISFFFDHQDEIACINQLLVNNGISVFQITTEHHQLDDLFVKLIQSN